MQKPALEFEVPAANLTAGVRPARGRGVLPGGPGLAVVIKKISSAVIIITTADGHVRGGRQHNGKATGISNVDCPLTRPLALLLV